MVEVPLLTVGGPLAPNLRALLLVGDFFLGGVIAASLTKLLLRLRALGAAAPVLNKAVAQGMLAIISIMRLGESPALATPLDGKGVRERERDMGRKREGDRGGGVTGGGMAPWACMQEVQQGGLGLCFTCPRTDVKQCVHNHTPHAHPAINTRQTDDSRERMAACVKVLASPNSSADSERVWLDDCRAAFSTLTSDKQSREAAEAAAESAKSFAQPDDLIDFGHLRSRKGGISQLELEDQVRLTGV